MSEQTAQLVERLRDRLRATVRRLTWANVAFGAAVTGGALTSFWLLVVLLEATLWLAPVWRTTALALGLAALCGVAGYYLVRPLLRLAGLLPDLSDEAMARRIGAHYPDVGDRLVNLLQLADGQHSSAPSAVVDRAVRRLGEAVDPVPFEEIETFERARQASRIASVPLVSLLVFLLAAPSTFFDASERMLAPGATFERPAPFTLAVTPGSTTLVTGDSLQVEVRASGETLPSTVTLAVRPDGEEQAERITLPAGADGRYQHTLVGLRQSTHYRVEAGPVTSAWYTARVQARPLTRRLQVTLDPPAYTGLPERTLDPNVGDVTALPGTRVQVEAQLGGPPVDSAAVAFADGTRQGLTVEDGVARGQFTLREAGHYRLRLRSTDGIQNADPIRYRLQLRADARPSIAFLAPESPHNVGDDLQTQLRLQMSDDFGFAQLRLYYRVAEKRFGTPDSTFSSMDLPLEAPRQLNQEVVHRWLLAQESGLDLVPGDEVEYYVRVWDNDAVAGYKSARTQTQRLRLASLEEQYETLDQKQESTADQMKDLQEQSESVQRQFRELRDELRRKQQADWEDKRQLDQLQQKQQQLQESVEKAAQQVEEMTRQMQQENLTSPETAKMYEELQRVIREINSPELNKALKQLEQSMQNMDLQQMQQALENFEFNEKQYQERLKRSLELFKQLRTQQKLDEAARRAENLRKTEEQLEQATKQRMQEQGQPPSDEQPPADSTGQADAASKDAQESEDAQEAKDAQEQGERAEDASSQEKAADGQKDGTEQQGSEQENAQQENAQQENAQQDSAQQPSSSSENESSSNEDLAREQERAREQMQQLQEELQKLQQQMGDQQSAPREKMQQMMQQMQRQQLPQQMQQNSQQLRQNQLNKARQGQQQMQQQLQQMRQRLQQMKQGMQGSSRQMNMAALRQALDNTLRLSRDQEALRSTVRSLSQDSPALRDRAQRQKRIADGLRMVTDSLQALARKVPQMSRTVQKESGDALREMEKATEALSKRESAPASSHQKASMMHLNELALLLSDLMNQMQQSGQGGGMSMQQMRQQLQKMSGQQQKLNRDVQQMLNDIQGNRLSVDQQQRLKQLARQQQQIKQALEELSKNGDANSKTLGDLNKIAEQMQQTIQELQQGRQSRETMERQQQILTRLLNAQKSLRQQGRKQERQGQTSDETPERTRPGELSQPEQVEQLRRDLIRALENGYAPDYEKLIRRYFDLLQKQQSGSESVPSDQR
jgi:hypothetical protein